MNNETRMKIRKFFYVDGDDPDLAIAQKTALSKQIPLMYFILLVNTWGVAITHLDIAPSVLTVYIPILLTIACAVRILSWWKRGRHVLTSGDKAVAELRRTNRVAWLLAAVFAGWGICLAPYGDEFIQSHVAFYMGITVIGCIFCLTHLLSAALAVTLVVDTIFIAYFGLTGNDIFVAMAVDVGLVSLAMLTVLWVQFRDFTNLIISRRELQEKTDALERRELELLERHAETQVLSNENNRLANRDTLTALPNRRLFFSTLDAMISGLTDKDMPIYVGLIDLDGFKPVNDLYGHGTGDDLLIQVAARLSEVCSTDAFVARLGGDEYGFVVRTNDTEFTPALGKAICAAIDHPFVVNDTAIAITASVGVANSGDVTGDIARCLYEMADYALYQAKRNAPGTTVMFSAEHQRHRSRLLVIEQALSDGSIDQDITLAFQPIFDLRAGKIVAFEALARWKHEKLGMVSPTEFIPVAERLGMINHLTRVLLAEALSQAGTWPHDIGLSFNLSTRDLASSDQAMRLLALIAHSGIAPHRVDLEITETAMLTDLPRARAIAETFRNAGIGIALDDFGTGYSSLTHLHSMPLNKIKIDRSFVTGMETEAASAKIVKSLIRMCEDMKLDCIVEGIETAAEMRAIQRLGACFVQGYFISKPVTAEDARLLVANPVVQRNMGKIGGDNQA